MPEREFTPAFMATGLICPPGKRCIEYGVMGESRLFAECRATPQSVPTWKVRLENAQGTNTYKTLGTIKELTLAQARKQAQLLKAQNEIDKQAWKKKPPQAEITLDTFMEDHYFPYAKIHKRSWLRDDQLYRIRIAPKFGQSKLAEITRYQVQQFQNELAEQNMSPASQDHHIKLLRRVLNLAIQWEFLERNVLKGIKLRMVENELHDVADDDQLLRLIEVLRSDENRPVCNILMYLLSTGARLNEALQATWPQVDMEKGIWTIPAANAKAKCSRSVPLNDSARYALEEASKLKTSEYIFANPKTRKPFTSITRVWYRLRKEAGISKMRIHSLRHQFASLLVSSGRSLYDVQILLGHSDPRVSQRYAKLSMQALKEASSFGSVIVPKAKQQESVITEAAPEPPTGNVVQFPKAA